MRITPALVAAWGLMLLGIAALTANALVAMGSLPPQPFLPARLGEQVMLAQVLALLAIVEFPTLFLVTARMEDRSKATMLWLATAAAVWIYFAVLFLLPDAQAPSGRERLQEIVEQRDAR